MTARKKAGTAMSAAREKPTHQVYQRMLPLREPSGQELRDQALAAHEERRSDIIEAGRRALLRHLLVHGTATADDVRDAVTLPDGVNPVCLGAVPMGLARAGIIQCAGHQPSRRPERHGAPTAVWAIVDETAARRWLAEHSGKGVADE